MSLFEKLFGSELPPPESDYFKRNSGKKILATVLAPTEEEIKQLTAQHDPTN